MPPYNKYDLIALLIDGNIILYPGARIEHVDNFLPQKNKNDLIALFIGGNNLLAEWGAEHSYEEPDEVADLLITLASSLNWLNSSIQQQKTGTN